MEPRVLHLVTYDFKGGAARAAWRIHQEMKSQGFPSQMLVQSRQQTADESIHSRKGLLPRFVTPLRRKLDRLPVRMYLRRKTEVFSPNLIPSSIVRDIRALQPDLIHLHWINEAFLQIEEIQKFKLPIVWSVQDMWPLTGGCHYDGGCGKFRVSCGSCPQLGSNQDRDLSSWTLNRKIQTFKDLKMAIAAPSIWIGDLAKQSRVFRDVAIHQIANGLNLKTFRLRSKTEARLKFGLPIDRTLLFFGAMNATSDLRKGFHLLKPALQLLAQKKLNSSLPIEVVIFGARAPSVPENLGFKIHYLPPFEDEERLAEVYAVADLIVIPSVEDNLPNMALEGLATGVPVAAFKIGGLVDMIDHRVNGVLAEPFSVESLAGEMAWALEGDARKQDMSAAARKKVEDHFDIQGTVESYKQLYKSLIS